MITKVLTATLGCILAFTQIATADPYKGGAKIGGAWVGRVWFGDTAVASWTALQIPLDADAKTGAVRVVFTSFGADFAGLATAFGADSWSDFAGHDEMISRDTARWTVVGYLQSKGPGGELVKNAIVVGHGTFRFVGADRAVLNTTISVYPISADADGNGMPDVGATPLITIPNLTETAQRIPYVQ